MSFFNPERRALKYCSVAALLLLLGHSQRVEGQSGRRATKPATETTPVPQPVTSPEPLNPAAKVTSLSGVLKNNVRLLVGRQSTQRHLQSEDAIFASFVNQLNSFTNVVATPIGELKRQEGAVQAKSMNDSFVVLLKFEIDSFQNGTIILNSPDLQIEYQVLAPRTGKKVTTGKVYFQSIGGGRLRKSEWPGGIPIRITPEAAGIEAAEHVHDWLRLDEARKVPER